MVVSSYSSFFQVKVREALSLRIRELLRQIFDTRQRLNDKLKAVRWLEVTQTCIINHPNSNISP